MNKKKVGLIIFSPIITTSIICIVLGLEYVLKIKVHYVGSNEYKLMSISDLQNAFLFYEGIGLLGLIILGRVLPRFGVAQLQLDATNEVK